LCFYTQKCRELSATNIQQLTIRPNLAETSCTQILGETVVLRLCQQGKREMLWTLFVVLLVLWLLGVVSSYTLGGFIHILLVLAVIALVFQLLSGRRTVV
jgi:hypothetical protein